LQGPRPSTTSLWIPLAKSSSQLEAKSIASTWHSEMISRWGRKCLSSGNSVKTTKTRITGMPSRSRSFRATQEPPDSKRWKAPELITTIVTMTRSWSFWSTAKRNLSCSKKGSRNFWTKAHSYSTRTYSTWPFKNRKLIKYSGRVTMLWKKWTTTLELKTNL
jgi:hypothetical protein